MLSDINYLLRIFFQISIFFLISGIPVHPAIPILQLRLTNLVPFAKKPSQTIFTKKIESLQDIPNMPMTVD